LPLVEVRPEPRTAASGNDAEPESCTRSRKPDSARLRPGLALSPVHVRRRPLGSAQTRAFTASAMPTTAFISTTRSPPPRVVARSKLARTSSPTAEWRAFMKDGGYTTPTLWLMDGFAAASNEQWQAPATGARIDGEWQIMTLGGLAGRSMPPPRSVMSAITRPTRSRAGAAGNCRPKWNGKLPPAPVSLNDAFRDRLAMDPQCLCALSRLPRDPKARSGETTASSWSTSCVAWLVACHPVGHSPRDLPQLLLSAPPLAIHGAAPCRLSGLIVRVHRAGTRVQETDMSMPRCRVGRGASSRRTDLGLSPAMRSTTCRSVPNVCRRNISTTRRFGNYSRPSPGCRDITPTRPSFRSCGTAAARLPPPSRKAPR